MSDKFQDVETDHEYDGIKEFDNPLPGWWLATFAITTLFAIYYWFAYHTLPAEGSFANHYAELADFNAKVAANAVSEEDLIAVAQDPAAVERGHKTFTTFCASCHGQQAQGQIGPNLTDAYWLYGGQPKDIWTTISFGRTVKGMPAWRPTLGDAKVNEVYAYVASIRNTNVAGKAPQGTDENGNSPQ
ncbi:MAG: c-type cytochrome [Myxococcales bacterium]|nr:c-type cytochrome [Myxococcales bacterium]MCB9735815.1 c-type cytochrome [Deltaproteobacteria bacterium]